MEYLSGDISNHQYIVVSKVPGDISLPKYLA
jgi:hypothetical protein